MHLERQVLRDGWTLLCRRDKSSITSFFLPPHRPSPSAGLSPQLVASSSSSRDAILPTPPPSFKLALLSQNPSRYPSFLPPSLLPAASFLGHCFRCLATSHLVRHCRSPVRCFRCNNLGHVAKRCSSLNKGCCPPPPPPSPSPPPPVTHVMPSKPHIATEIQMPGLGGDRPFFGCWACGARMKIVLLPFEAPEDVMDFPSMPPAIEITHSLPAMHSHGLLSCSIFQP